MNGYGRKYTGANPAHYTKLLAELEREEQHDYRRDHPHHPR